MVSIEVARTGQVKNGVAFVRRIFGVPHVQEEMSGDLVNDDISLISYSSENKSCDFQRTHL